MKFVTIKPVLLTSIISFSLIGTCILILYCAKGNLFRWTDPTAELRNVSLGILAIGGIPFLILGHLTKRKDVEAKQQDLMFRTDALINEILTEKIESSSQKILEIFKIVFPLEVNGTFKFPNKKKYTIIEHLRECWSGDDVLYPNQIDSFMSDIITYDVQEELNRHVVTICHVLRMKQQLRNPDFSKMISINLISSLPQEEFINLLYITSVNDFDFIKSQNDNISDTDLILNEIIELSQLGLVSKNIIKVAEQIPQRLIESEGLLRGREK